MEQKNEVTELDDYITEVELDDNEMGICKFVLIYYNEDWERCKKSEAYHAKGYTYYRDGTIVPDIIRMKTGKKR